jgi:hypothetical protein
MILLCAASDNYAKKYAPCIESHKKWCNKNNYTYKLISGPDDSQNWKRAKVKELYNLLTTTGENVLLIDGDCYIKDTCPKVNFLNSKSIYYAVGKSLRLNSGFLYFKNDQNSINFVEELIEKLAEPVPRGKGYYVTKEGENGHIIWIKDEWENSYKDVFQEISNFWNCSSKQIKESAYILHFTNDLRREIRKYNEEYFRSPQES